jgi:hypothetical protein
LINSAGASGNRFASVPNRNPRPPDVSKKGSAEPGPFSPVRALKQQPAKIYLLIVIVLIATIAAMLTVTWFKT